MEYRAIAHRQYVFVAHNAGRWVMRAGLVVSSSRSCVGVTLTISERSVVVVVIAGVRPYAWSPLVPARRRRSRNASPSKAR